MWLLDEVAEALATALAEREAQYLQEQAYAGLDALSEVELHAVLTQGLRHRGMSVLGEVPFPSQVKSRRKVGPAQRREREHCDLVLLPDGTNRLHDPKDSFADECARALTLFAHLDPDPQEPADSDDLPTRSPAPSGAQGKSEAPALPGDACWIELKAAGQHRFVDGVPVSHHGYSGFVSGCLADARKLSRDPLIEFGYCGVILFTADRAIAEHDLAMMVHKLLDKDAPIRDSLWRSIDIVDRIGNSCCTVALMRVRQD
jgi:hypothetical protein